MTKNASPAGYKGQARDSAKIKEFAFGMSVIRKAQPRQPQPATQGRKPGSR
ncbi:MAG: hypothetical protein QOD77_212 [Thermoplasmata archaeon]|jgi:hypothetical protein|nr:hypothetical protein [Thermoplasmata archaeon]